MSSTTEDLERIERSWLEVMVTVILTSLSTMSLCLNALLSLLLLRPTRPLRPKYRLVLSQTLHTLFATTILIALSIRMSHEASVHSRLCALLQNVPISLILVQSPMHALVLQLEELARTMMLWRPLHLSRLATASSLITWIAPCILILSSSNYSSVSESFTWSECLRSSLRSDHIIIFVILTLLFVAIIIQIWRTVHEALYDNKEEDTRLLRTPVHLRHGLDQPAGAHRRQQCVVLHNEGALNKDVLQCSEFRILLLIVALNIPLIALCEHDAYQSLQEMNELLPLFRPAPTLLYSLFLSLALLCTTWIPVSRLCFDEAIATEAWELAQAMHITQQTLS